MTVILHKFIKSNLSRAKKSKTFKMTIQTNLELFLTCKDEQEQTSPHLIEADEVDFHDFATPLDWLDDDSSAVSMLSDSTFDEDSESESEMFDLDIDFPTRSNPRPRERRTSRSRRDELRAAIERDSLRLDSYRENSLRTRPRRGAEQNDYDEDSVVLTRRRIRPCRGTTRESSDDLPTVDGGHDSLLLTRNRVPQRQPQHEEDKPLEFLTINFDEEVMLFLDVNLEIPRLGRSLFTGILLQQRE
jgi:hypothetical protein